MRESLNQYSSALVVLVLFLGVWLLVRRRGPLVRRAAAVGVVVVIAGGLLLLRTGPGDIQAVTDLDRVVGDGRPVMLELYSNW